MFIYLPVWAISPGPGARLGRQKCLGRGVWKFLASLFMAVLICVTVCFSMTLGYTQAVRFRLNLRFNVIHFETGWMFTLTTKLTSSRDPF